MTWQAEHFVDARGKRHGSIANRDDSVRGICHHRLNDRLQRSRLVEEPDRNRLIPPRVFELVASIAGKDQTDAELLGGLAERSNLVSRRRCDDENALQIRRMSSAEGSAQQYHASVMCGTVRGCLDLDMTPRITSCCSASTRGSRCLHGHVSDAGSTSVTTA